MGGGAGQLTLVELPVSFVFNMTKYVITVGLGGIPTGNSAAGDGGGTSFNSGAAASASYGAQGGYGASGNHQHRTRWGRCDPNYSTRRRIT